MSPSDMSKIRIGRLLEIMDFMAGRVSYSHCYATEFATRDITNVTAACDHLEFYPVQISMDENLIVESYVSWTGKSSIETRIDVINHEGRIFCSAYYVMVARDKLTHKARQVPELILENDEINPSCNLRFQMGI
jgi:acyl-coenzyme A thioesterase 9